MSKVKQAVTSLGIFSLILGSIFVLCYVPFMKMTSFHFKAAQTTHMATGLERCCENQANPHAQASAAITTNASALENLLTLLGLAGLFLFVSFRGNAKNQAGLKFRFTRRFISKLYDYLALAFSRGVLHPKLYNI